MVQKKFKFIQSLWSVAMAALTLFLSSTAVAFAQTSTSGSTTQSQNGIGSGAAGVVIAYLICNGRKRKAIGGWLLYYYMQLYAGFIFVILLLGLGAGFSFDDILLLVELVLASMLLVERFKSQRIFNILRMTFVAQFVFGIINVLILQENMVLGIFPIAISLFSFLYFTFSKRVHIVLVENAWDSKSLYLVEQSVAQKGESMAGKSINVSGFKITVSKPNKVTDLQLYEPYFEGDIEQFNKVLGPPKVVERHDGIMTRQWHFTLKSDTRSEKAFIVEADVVKLVMGHDTANRDIKKWEIHAESSEGAKALFDYFSNIL